MKKGKKRVISLLLCAALIAAGLFAGCSAKPQQGENGEEKVLNIFTWATYFPDDVLKEFEDSTGIKINYSNFESNEEMLMKLQAAKGGDYDIVLASDYIIDIARKENLLYKLDKEQIPHFGDIDPAFQGKYYDEMNEYTVPYSAGVPQIIYNPDLVDFTITGYEDLWNPKLKDNVVIMDDARNVIGLTLKTMGKSLNETDEATLNQAKEKLMELGPNIRALDYSTPYNLMIEGEAAVGYMFTSQVATALAANDKLKTVYPKEGLGFGIDSCFVPVNAPHPGNAHKFLDFILDGERSAHITEQTLYLNCVTTAQPFIKNPVLTLSDDMLKDAEFIKDIGEAASMYDSIWTEFKQSLA
jgi:spermidine/putrescine transport system substrate-binding protein